MQPQAGLLERERQEKQLADLQKPSPQCIAVNDIEKARCCESDCCWGEQMDKFLSPEDPPHYNKVSSTKGGAQTVHNIKRSNLTKISRTNTLGCVGIPQPNFVIKTPTC